MWTQNLGSAWEQERTDIAGTFMPIQVHARTSICLNIHSPVLSENLSHDRVPWNLSPDSAEPQTRSLPQGIFLNIGGFSVLVSVLFSKARTMTPSARRVDHQVLQLLFKHQLLRQVQPSVINARRARTLARQVSVWIVKPLREG